MNKPTDLLGDTIRDALAIETEHAEQCQAFDAAAAAHALLADRARWNKYVTLARKLHFGWESEAMVFLAAASPVPTKGRKAKDPIEAWLYAQADAEGHGPHSRHHGAAVVRLRADDPTDGIAYDVAGGMDYHAATRAVSPPKAASPESGVTTSDRAKREIARKRRAAREAGQGFFAGLAFRAPRDPDADDLIPEGV